VSVPPAPASGFRRHLPTAGVLLAAAVLWPFLLPTPAAHGTGSQAVALVLIGLSLTVTVGWLRVVTLFQPAAVAAGAAATGALLVRGHGAGVALAGAAVLGGIAGMLALAPAAADPRRWLPATSLLLTVATGLVVPRYVFRPLAPPALLGMDLGRHRTLYFTGLAVAALACAVVGALQRARFGRRLLTVGAGAGAGDVPGSPRPWVEGVALSGALAGIAGWVGMILHEGLPSPLDFAPTTAIAYLAIPLLGGAWSIAGALVGAAVFLLAARIALAMGHAAVTLPAVLLVVAAVMGRPGGLAGWATRVGATGRAAQLLRRLRLG